MTALDALTRVLQSDPPAFTPEEVVTLARERFGLHGKASLLVSERDQNFALATADGGRYLVRIANTLEDPGVIDFENRALDHIARVDPSVPVPSVIPDHNGLGVVPMNHDSGDMHLIRVLSWLPGSPLQGRPMTPSLRRQLGNALAQLGLALRGFFHPAAARPLLWDIKNAASLADLLEHVTDPEAHALCADFLARFRGNVACRLPALRAQVFYNDLNPSNVLASEGANPHMTGIVDFGDMVHGPLICDIAVAAAYQLGSDGDPLAGALDFVEAYSELCPLEADELDVLHDLIMARLVTTTVITSWRASRYPDNRDYILRNAPAALARLQRMWAIAPATARNRFAERLDRDTFVASSTTAPGDASITQADASPKSSVAEDLLQRRHRLLGSAYRLFYDDPLHIVRGRGVWLYDARGRAYLDGYNNVALVGHCHPAVVAVLARQAATLNTHTRYLHDKIVDYAERLLGLFPDYLDRVMFGCTGSEANELALRMARAYTGNRGVIVSDYAYHGNTSAIAQMSPSYGTLPDGKVDWIETFPAPDTYRGPGADSAEALAEHCLTGIDQAIVRLAKRGVKPAAVWLDVGFTSDGMYRAPPGLIAGIAQRVRAAGGLVVADEVQAGFARLGETLWGYQMHDIDPDIVTLGKPIGNGHPLSATVMRRAVLDEFSSRGRYFNTFGGNPVSAAVGLAVLDTFEREELASNARDTGAYLHQRLAELMDKHERITQVRGSGLFAGVEVVKDRDSRVPDPGTTNRLINAMKDSGVLISSIGRHDSALKIRPPLPFSRDNVDQLVDTLHECLTRL